MADEMDPCECLWNHEMAMRRIISLLRQGQAYCTDNECLDQLPGSNIDRSSASNSFMMMFLMMAVLIGLAVMHPIRRRQIQDVAKPESNSQDDDGAPPAPPRT